jgi:hypothetical protein
MDRRRFLRAGLLPALFGSGLVLSAGCSDGPKETGTMVQTPPEDLKSMEASAAAYKSMSKKK